MEFVKNTLRNRIIPVLTINDRQLVKTVRFKKPNYIGDPINAVKIFNDKEVDEIILLDIRASLEKREPNYELIEEICSEAFMPFAYGGGINRIHQVEKLFAAGIEKVVLNSVLYENPELVSQIAAQYGSQSVVASIDIQKNIFGKYIIFSLAGRKKQKIDLEQFIKKLEELGIGELFINCIHKDGSFEDYDYELIQTLASKTKVPLIACGGANSPASFRQVIEAGASAASAGSLFVYRGKEKGILINFPR